MHTRRGGRSSPLVFDPEIERTARSNRVTRRLFNRMEGPNAQQQQAQQQPPPQVEEVPQGVQQQQVPNVAPPPPIQPQ